MPQIPKNTIAFTRAPGADSRMDLNSIYGIPKPLPFDPEMATAAVLRETESLVHDVDQQLPEVQAKLQALLHMTYGPASEQDAEIQKQTKRNLLVMSNTIADAISAAIDTKILIPKQKPSERSQDGKLQVHSLVNSLLSIADLEYATGFTYAGNFLGPDGAPSSPEFVAAAETILLPLKERLERHAEHLSVIFNDDACLRIFAEFQPHHFQDNQEYIQQLRNECGTILEWHEKHNRRVAYEDWEGLKFQASTLEELVQNERAANALYLRTLSKMLAEKGYDVSAEKIYTQQIYGFFGASPILRVKDFTVGQEENQIRGLQESTTSFFFTFGFIDKPFEDQKTDKIAGIRSPIFEIDAKAIALLKKHGVAKSSIDSLLQGFMKMGALSEHDGDAHQTIVNKKSLSSLVKFPDDLLGDDEKQVKQQFNFPDSLTGMHLEDHALALHAQILARMFAESPKRKAHVLAYAKESYLQLHEMQQTALTTCTTEQEKAQVNEAITYFAEIYAHRLFRVISPEDKDLVTHGVTTAMDKLLLTAPHQPDKVTIGDGLTTLYNLCAEVLQDTYKRIHTLDLFPLVELEETEGFTDTIKSGGMVSALEVLGRVTKDVARREADPSGYLAEHAYGASKMREALQLRQSGNWRNALEIEQALRQREHKLR